MRDLTPQQEAALAIFKTNLHLPHGGFHSLIIELCKEYQLPFQTVRSVLMKVQRATERRIYDELDTVAEDDLSQENWREAIKIELIELAQDNQPVMNNLLGNEHYLKAKAAIELPISSEDGRDIILEDLMLAYEKEVFKPLLAMLHTTSLYWELMLAEELHMMTEACRQKFIEYPQYIEAAKFLFDLDSKVRAQTLRA
ncbi:hypothetical protein L4C39_01455 [Vibrio clamense]|uniref:hypothetical protein n=1 Tax=Vibrio clamense TaxID=2910254 RepID=UPI003D1DB5B7